VAFTHTANPDTPYTLPMNNVAVTADLAVGETIPGTARNFTISGQCRGGTHPEWRAGLPIVACYRGTQVMPGVYATGIVGVGIRIRNSQGEVLTGVLNNNCKLNPAAAAVGTLGAALAGPVVGVYPYAFTATIELVKTGRIGRGTLSAALTRFMLAVAGPTTGDAGLGRGG